MYYGKLPDELASSGVFVIVGVGVGTRDGTGVTFTTADPVDCVMTDGVN